MKYIEKKPEPQSFADWKKLANDDWQPTYETLSGSVKKDVKIALMAEQGDLCCYCERRLADEDSHIEHFRPQSDPTVDPLDFANMICSCQNHLKKGEPLHCGNLKGDWFDLDLLVSPLDRTCEARFAFTGDGYIQPAEKADLSAVTTIEKLGLDVPKLRALRKSALDSFLDDDLSQEELQSFVTGYLRPSETGRFNEFWTTIRYLFREY
jgi:uncharacterized protein (TIGR02646 family)